MIMPRVTTISIIDRKMPVMEIIQILLHMLNFRIRLTQHREDG